MKIEVCENCENFVQHYTYSKFGLTKTNCGHCHKKQMKKKDCLFFNKSSKNYNKEISIFDEISKYKLTLDSIIFKIKTLNSLLNKIEKQIVGLKKEKHK